MAAENEEALMELYFDKGTLTEDEMRKGMKMGMLQRDLFPVFCTCARKDIGVGRLIEFIVNIAPAPNERESQGNRIRETAKNGGIGRSESLCF